VDRRRPTPLSRVACCGGGSRETVSAQGRPASPGWAGSPGFLGLRRLIWQHATSDVAAAGWACRGPDLPATLAILTNIFLTPGKSGLRSACGPGITGLARGGRWPDHPAACCLSTSPVTRSSSLPSRRRAWPALCAWLVLGKRVIIPRRPAAGPCGFACRLPGRGGGLQPNSRRRCAWLAVAAHPCRVRRVIALLAGLRFLWSAGLASRSRHHPVPRPPLAPPLLESPPRSSAVRLFFLSPSTSSPGARLHPRRPAPHAPLAWGRCRGACRAVSAAAWAPRSCVPLALCGWRRFFVLPLRSERQPYFAPPSSSPWC